MKDDLVTGIVFFLKSILLNPNHLYIYFYLSTLELKSTYVFMIKTEQTGNLSSIDNM